MRHYRSPEDMYQEMCRLTLPPGATAPVLVRNFCGVIEDMGEDQLIVETPLFPREAIEFYTRYNLDQLTEEDKRSGGTFEKYYNAARGGAQGDYRENIEHRIANVVDCLRRFPNSKRAVLSIASPASDHTTDAEAKCLREIHFYLDETSPTSSHAVLSANGFMRAQAATIFPKNIHFIGTILHQVARQLQAGPGASSRPIRVGNYLHFVTTLVNGRE